MLTHIYIRWLYIIHCVLYVLHADFHSHHGAHVVQFVERWMCFMDVAMLGYGYGSLCDVSCPNRTFVGFSCLVTSGPTVDDCKTGGTNGVIMRLWGGSGLSAVIEMWGGLLCCWSRISTAKRCQDHRAIWYFWPICFFLYMFKEKRHLFPFAIMLSKRNGACIQLLCNHIKPDWLRWLFNQSC